MTTDASQGPNETTSKTASLNPINEGAVEILAPNSRIEVQTNGNSKFPPPSKPGTTPQTVFYNPIQQFNRDLSVVAIRVFAEDWEASVARRQAHRRPNQQRKQGKKRKREAQDGTHGDVESEGGVPIPQEEASEKVAKLATVAEKGGKDIEETSLNPEDAKSAQGTRHEAVAPVAAPAESSGAAVETQSEKQNVSPAGETDSKPVNGVDGIPRTAFRILDALSASGLRALRYAKEIPQVTTAVANDLSPAACESIQRNIAHNYLTEKVRTSTGDAIDHMRHTSSRSKGPPKHYHVIDLDPYGTASPFLDAAVQAVTDGGLLCVTCTDSAIFASVAYLEKTFSQYGGLPVKGPHAHEGGLRLILNAIATSAARYGIAIEPLLSLSIDFYARVFVRVHKSPAEVKYLASKTMSIYSCDHGCGAWEIQFLARAKARQSKNGETYHNFTCGIGPTAETECRHCGFRTHLAGPMWGGALHNPVFVKKMLEMLPKLDPEVYGTIPRMEGMLTTALEEIIDDPFAGEVANKASLPKASTRETEAVIGKATANEQSPDPIPRIPQEHRASHPFFFYPHQLARVLGVSVPADAVIRGALRSLGYKATRSHTKAGSIATDASWAVLWEIMREYIRQNDLRVSPKPGTAGWAIMRNDRSLVKTAEFRKDMNSRLSSVRDLEGLKTELEAGLTRLSNLIGHAEKPSVTTPLQDDAVPSILLEDRRSRSPSPSRAQLVPPTHTLDIKFDSGLGKNIDSNGRVGDDGGLSSKKLRRYQVNPRDWGPLSKAKG